MANVDFDMTVQQTVINVTDQTGETFDVTPQPKVEVSVSDGYELIAKEATLTQGIQDLKNATAKEATLNSAKEEIIEAVNSAQVEIDTSNLASKNLEDFFEVVPDDSEEAITDDEITQELEDIFNTIFN